MPLQVRAVATTSTTSSMTCTQTSNILYGYIPASPNNGTTFLLDTSLAAQAIANVWPPAGFYTSFTSAFAGLFAPSYLGYVQLSSYDTSACGNICLAWSGCKAFNIYFQRTPSYVPNNVTCKNPSAKTAVTCALYGSYVDGSTALNIGQYQADFMVVIQGVS